MVLWAWRSFVRLLVFANPTYRSIATPWNPPLRSYFTQLAREEPHPIGGLLNRTNGNFATNYLSADFRYRRGSLDGSEHIVWSWTAGLRAEFHVPMPGGLTPAEADIYGRWRVRAMGEYLRELSWARLRVEASLQYVPVAANAVVPYILAGEADLIFPSAGGLGVFVRAVIGQDYYNAFFVDRLDQVQFGLLFDLSPSLTFGGRPSGS